MLWGDLIFYFWWNLPPPKAAICRGMSWPDLFRLFLPVVSVRKYCMQVESCNVSHLLQISISFSSCAFVVYRPSCHAKPPSLEVDQTFSTCVVEDEKEWWFCVIWYYNGEHETNSNGRLKFADVITCMHNPLRNMKLRITFISLCIHHYVLNPAANWMNHRLPAQWDRNYC